MPELDLPPESLRDKLPYNEDQSDLFNAGGWGAVLPVGTDLNWDQAGQKQKPQMVIDDNEQARKDGFRER